MKQIISENILIYRHSYILIDIMSQDKEPKRSDVDKLRKILDNPDDPSIKKSITKDEKNLDSIAKRLSGESSKDKHLSASAVIGKDSTSLEPRVTIHDPEEKKSAKEPELQEFETVEDESPEEISAVKEQRVDAADLYEIEKVESSAEKFVEVKPKEDIEEFKELPEKPAENPVVKEEVEEPIHSNKQEELSDWEPIEEEPSPQDKESTPSPPEEELPSFEMISEELEEKVDTWEPIEEEPSPTEPATQPPSSEETFEAESAPVCHEPIKSRNEKKLERKAEKVIKKEEKKKQKELRKKQKEELRQAQIAQKTSSQTTQTENTEFQEDTPSNEFSTDTHLEVFNNLSSINEKTASLLYAAGFTTISQLQESSVEDLTKIKGINKKTAKRIKDEVGSNDVQPTTSFEFVGKKTDESAIKDEDPSEWESYTLTEESAGFVYKEYTLYCKQMNTKKGKTRVIHFFSKEKPEEGEPVSLPEGYKVALNKKTGLPYLKKKK